MKNSCEKYNDIINLPNHKSKIHPHMSMEARAAQFASFSALTGLEDEIDEVKKVSVKNREIGNGVEYGENI